MVLLLFIVLLGFLTITGTNGLPPSRVVSGMSAMSNEFPFSVILKGQYGHFCGGAIISPRHILTAAHCLFNENPETFEVVSALKFWKYKYAIISEVENFHMHPNYVDFSVNRWLENDIAVITLKEKLDLDGATLKAAKLPVSQYMDKTVAISIGFGPTSISTTDDTPPFARYLQKVDMTIDNEICETYSHKAWGEFFCGRHSKAALCGGDSGSPLVVGDTVIGITSSAVCQPGGVAVYTNVFHHMKFIQDILSKDNVSI